MIYEAHVVSFHIWTHGISLIATKQKLKKLGLQIEEKMVLNYFVFAYLYIDYFIIIQKQL